jgi:hypothetical protein
MIGVKTARNSHLFEKIPSLRMVKTNADLENSQLGVKMSATLAQS